MVLNQLFRASFNVASNLYRRVLAKRLKDYGLKYDDILLEKETVQLAVSRLPAAVRVERERRLKRAYDLSAKKKTLPEEFRHYDAFEPYLQKEIQIAQEEKTEKVLLH